MSTGGHIGKVFSLSLSTNVLNHTINLYQSAVISDQPFCVV